MKNNNIPGDNKTMIKIEKPIDYIGIIVFAVLIIFWCDLDIQGWLVYTGLTTNIRLGLFLSILVVTGILIFKYLSQTLGVLMFVLILLITKAMLGYTELFTTSTKAISNTNPSTTTKATTTTNPNLAPISEFSGSADEVQQFLLRQIADDPNTTTVDKRVMQDLTEKYFKSSSKLAELRGFNIASESANMLPGQQVVVGLDTVKNQH